MTTEAEGSILRIFVGCDEKFDGIPLYEWLVRRALERGLMGATVLRGVEGFGTRGTIHTSKILRLATDLPVVVEIVDTADKVEAFLPAVDHAMHQGVATIQPARLRSYRASA